MADPSKMLLRIPEKQKRVVEYIARADGSSQNEVVCAAVEYFVEAKKKDKKFQDQLRKMAESDQETLGNLTSE